METRKDIAPQMRSILVDWLVEVQECFELYHETLYLGVKLVDHFLENTAIQKDELQLVGATALIISSKIEVKKHFFVLRLVYNGLYAFGLMQCLWSFNQSTYRECMYSPCV